MHQSFQQHFRGGTNALTIEGSVVLFVKHTREFIFSNPVVCPLGHFSLLFLGAFILQATVLSCEFVVERSNARLRSFIHSVFHHLAHDEVSLRSASAFSYADCGISGHDTRPFENSHADLGRQHGNIGIVQHTTRDLECIICELWSAMSKEIYQQTMMGPSNVLMTPKWTFK